MNLIPLTNGGFATVDPEDYDVLVKYSWGRCRCAKAATFYARMNYCCDRNRIRMHIFLMGKRDGYVIDHRNGNGLDNQRSNLRWATWNQNAANGPKRRDNTSGVTGVTWFKHGNWEGWRAGIGWRGKFIHIGCFDDMEAAKSARIRAEQELFGEFSPTISRC